MWYQYSSLVLCWVTGVLAKHDHVYHELVRRATPTAGPSPAGPTQTGTVSGCNKWYTVQNGDDCSVPEKAFGITHTQFLQWNQAVSQDCVTNFWPTYSYCVGIGSVVTATSKSSTTTKASTLISSSTSRISSTTIESSTTINATYSIRNPVYEWNITTPTINSNGPPTQTKAGQPSYCNKWHLIKSGDNCDKVVRKYASTMDMIDFLAWNPTVDTDCSGLFLNFWVCVGIQPQTSLTLSYNTGTVPITIPPSTAFTPTANPTINSSFIATPTQAGLAADCQGFYKAVAGDTCPKVLEQFKFLTQQQFLVWNPALGSKCDIWAETYYCIADFASSGLPMPPTVTVKPSPVQTDTSSNCVAWYMMTVDDTCDSIAEIFGTFSKADFISWNPGVWSDCSKIQEHIYYCVAIPGTPRTRTASIPTTTFPSDNPKQTGIITGCTSLWVVTSSDTCVSIASFNRITTTDFYAWNPAVGSNCTNLLPGYSVCVEVAGTTPTNSTVSSVAGSTVIPSTTKALTMTSTAPTKTATTSAAGGVVTPSPTQTGMTTGCVRFYYVNAGEGCYDIANKNGITLDNFYAWNMAAAPDCAGLWTNVYVCIGISGSPTTVISKPT